jgi:hypothetical protein
MDSQPVDQSPDPLLAFAAEASVTPTPDREPAFLRIPTPYDGHLSITSIAEQAPSETARGWRVTTFLVVVGVLAGFVGGYAFADRIIAPAAPPAHRIIASAPAPAPAPAAAPLVAPPSSESPTPRTEPSTDPSPESSVVKAAQANVAPVPSAPSTTKRASIPASTTRPSTTTRPRPAVAPITDHGGAIEIMSRPRGAKVLLDGNVVGLAPMSIPDVPEGIHEVRVELDGFSPWVGSVRVKGGSRARVGASLEHE